MRQKDNLLAQCLNTSNLVNNNPSNCPLHLPFLRKKRNKPATGGDWQLAAWQRWRCPSRRRAEPRRAKYAEPMMIHSGFVYDEIWGRWLVTGDAWQQWWCPHDDGDDDSWRWQSYQGRAVTGLTVRLGVAHSFRLSLRDWVRGSWFVLFCANGNCQKWRRLCQFFTIGWNGFNRTILTILAI